MTAVVMCFTAALLLTSGCTGSRLPVSDAGSASALRGADSTMIKKEFVDSMLITAFESKSPEAIRGLLDRPLAGAAHWQSIADIACALNKPRMEVGALNVSSGSAGEGFLVSEISFAYKLYGFTGLNYDLFVKEGKLAVTLKTSFGEQQIRQKVTADAFGRHYHIKGRVVTAASKPLAFAAVTLSSGNYDYSCTSGGNGEFAIEFIDSEGFSLCIDRPGYKPLIKQIENIKKGEYNDLGELVVEKMPGASGAGSAGEETSNAAPMLTPGIKSFANGLSAVSLDKAAKLNWKFPADAANKKFSCKIFRKSVSDEKFKLAATLQNEESFTDEGLSNANIYIYKAEAFADETSNSPAAAYGPVAVIPSSHKTALEFEDIVSTSLKWSGVKPLKINDDSFSGSGCIAFDPLKTSALSFLTPHKIKNGYYKAFLYVKRSKKSAAMKIEIKQFGEPEENKSFFRGEVSLKSINLKENRDVIELGEMLIEPKSWKNETLPEDYCEMAVKISKTEETVSEKDGEKAENGPGGEAALDVIEFVKID